MVLAVLVAGSIVGVPHSHVAHAEPDPINWIRAWDASSGPGSDEFVVGDDVYYRASFTVGDDTTVTEVRHVTGSCGYEFDDTRVFTLEIGGDAYSWVKRTLPSDACSGT